MKRFVGCVIMLLIAVQCFAAQYHGTTILQRDDVNAVDSWFTTAQKQPRTGSLELKGYNSVRVDVDKSTDSSTVTGNLVVSNDTIWVSGDTLTFTKDTYQDVILQGGSDYYFNIDSISAGTVDVYLTPFNQ